MTLAIGLHQEETLTVTEALTVPAVSQAFVGFADMPPVFATAFLVGFAEWTCIEALRPHLAAGEQTVGVHVDLSHVAATPVRMRVTVAVELIGIDGRRLRFRVECRDEVELIGAGFHDRAIIDALRFRERVSRKQRRDGGGR